MTFELRKFYLMQFLATSQDEFLISEMEKLVNKRRAKAYEAKLKPMSEEELIKRAMISEKDFKNSRVTDAGDLEKEMENW